MEAYETLDTKFEDVVEWAKNQPEDRVVHDTTGLLICSTCFFANYYSDRFEEPVEVGYTTATAKSWGGVTWVHIPEWVTNAISALDRVEILHAGEAVAVLEKLDDKGDYCG